MPNLNIQIIIGNEIKKEMTATSESNMWVHLREVRDNLTEEDLAAGTRAIITDENGVLFKDISFTRVKPSFTKQKRSTIQMSETSKKRVRRDFGTIILQQFDAKAEKITPRKYRSFRKALERLLGKFETLQEEAKKAQKFDKRKYNVLKNFSKEELESYVSTLK